MRPHCGSARAVRGERGPGRRGERPPGISQLRSACQFKTTFGTLHAGTTYPWVLRQHMSPWLGGPKAREWYLPRKSRCAPRCQQQSACVLHRDRGCRCSGKGLSLIHVDDYRLQHPKCLADAPEVGVLRNSKTSIRANPHCSTAPRSYLATAPI